LSGLKGRTCFGRGIPQIIINEEVIKKALKWDPTGACTDFFSEVEVSPPYILEK